MLFLSLNHKWNVDHNKTPIFLSVGVAIFGLIGQSQTRPDLQWEQYDYQLIWNSVNVPARQRKLNLHDRIQADCISTIALCDNMRVNI